MRNPNRETIFHFKQFSVINRKSAMKVGTDGVLLGAWLQAIPQRILDVGCGTGVIALMMAQRFAEAEIFAVEVDKDSADEAVENFANSPWASRLHLLHTDFTTIPLPAPSPTPAPSPNAVSSPFPAPSSPASLKVSHHLASIKAPEPAPSSPAPLKVSHTLASIKAPEPAPSSPAPLASKKICVQFPERQLRAKQLLPEFDLIVSNPPFFTNGELAPDQSRKQARHESSLTLSILLKTAKSLLSPTGKIALILPADRLSDLKMEATLAGLGISRLCKVSTVPTKPPRRILAELSSTKHVSTTSNHTESLSIQSSDNKFSPEYINLLKEFYLKF